MNCTAWLATSNNIKTTRGLSLENQNQRNLILAVVLSALLLFGWDAGVRYFYPNAGKSKPVASASESPVASP